MAFVSYVVEERFTDLVVAEMVIKRGVVFCRHERESGFEKVGQKATL